MTTSVYAKQQVLMLLGAVAVLAVLISRPVAEPVPVAAAQSQSQTQQFFCNGVNGGHQDFSVPAGVTQLRVEAHGGQGQTRRGSLPGGYGGITIATVAVTPGEVLDVWAGCYGGNFSGAGWGPGGAHGIAHASDAQDGGFGGGGSGVIRTTGSGVNEIITELVVAGGGGGGGGNGGGSGIGGQGGGGGAGGISPQPGQEGCGGEGCPTGGGGGAGGCAACMGAGNINGGDGTGSSTADSGGGGGGGGGGHIGGGGGHGGGGFIIGNGGGGGGGGSSYVIPSAANVSYGTDTSGGDGIVILSWTPGDVGQRPPGIGLPGLALPPVSCGGMPVTASSIAEYVELRLRCAIDAVRPSLPDVPLPGPLR